MSQLDRYLLPTFHLMRNIKIIPQVGKQFLVIIKFNHNLGNVTPSPIFHFRATIAIATIFLMWKWDWIPRPSYQKMLFLHSECYMLPLLYNPKLFWTCAGLYNTYWPRPSLGLNRRKLIPLYHLPTRPRQRVRVRFKYSTEGTENLRSFTNDSGGYIIIYLPN